MYKLYSQVLGEEPSQLLKTLRKLGIRLSRDQINLNPRPLLRLVLSQFVGQSTGFVDIVTTNIPSPLQAAAQKVNSIYTGNLNTTVAKAMQNCDQSGDLMVNIVKLFSEPDGQSFTAFGRVYSGKIEANSHVKVLGESYSDEDDEDMSRQTIGSVSVAEGRYRINVNCIPAGNWVMIEGLDNAIIKTATLTNANDMNGVTIFKPLLFNTASVMKLAVEPLNPSELPKMLEGLRKIAKSYPLAITKVEESGEHVILCTGEMAADCILHDLRRMYANIEIKVADPVTLFCETVIETSSMKYVLANYILINYAIDAMDPHRTRKIR